MRTERQRSVGRDNDLRDSARGGTRTLKARRPPDFESDASAGSATRALCSILFPVRHLPGAYSRRQPPVCEFTVRVLT